MAASYSYALSNLKNDNNELQFWVGIISFFAILVESVIIQQKAVDTTKAMNPEKTASVYDTKFHKKWLDSCDEAEKVLIGKCAYKAFSVMNTMCMMLAVVLAIGALTFNIGFLPSLVVCLIWLVSQTVFTWEAIRYSKAGNKVL